MPEPSNNEKHRPYEVRFPPNFIEKTAPYTLEGVEVLEYILRNFKSGFILDEHAPEISYFDGVPYIIVADPSISNNNGRYGLAINVLDASLN